MTDRPNLRDLVAAQLALLRARRRLRLEPIGNLTERRQRRSAQPSGDPQRAEQLARAVHVAASRGLFRPFCLVRALALESLLLEHGITGSDIRIGVRRQREKKSGQCFRYLEGAV